MEEKMLAARDYALIDLHLHLNGSLSLASVRQLAAMEQLAKECGGFALRHLGSYLVTAG